MLRRLIQREALRFFRACSSVSNITAFSFPRCAVVDAADALEIALADDGPGIAPEHHESMFLPFRTLGSAGEGMGLAIVQKMLDAVGGTIRLQSDALQQRGTTFIVRWPCCHRVAVESALQSRGRPCRMARGRHLLRDGGHRFHRAQP
jgi:hypothetical protein